ncbi:hypothetical protein [uncultured Streptococcus sp.]|uniref:hypothetical protein n=1 Tax=uncultured Streptococcus sp. TaxID=83427 RepID=UPI0028E5A1DA|nr:hypothetical protein [uncultured Streptococcus sp.]
MSEELLKETVVELSIADNWEEAKMEWTKAELVKIDADRKQSCLCGHKSLKKVFAITRNDGSGIELSPIGSSCIEKFENEELTKSIKRAEKTYKLKKNLKFEDLREVMDEEMLEDFYSRGYFKEDKENEFNPWNDYILFKMALSRKNEERQLAYNKIERIIYVINDYLHPELNEIFDIESYKEKLKQWRKEAKQEEQEAETRNRIAKEEEERKLEGERLQREEELKLLKRKNLYESFEELKKWLQQQGNRIRSEYEEKLSNLTDLAEKVKVLKELKQSELKQSQEEAKKDEELVLEALEMREKVKALYSVTPRARKCLEYLDANVHTNKGHLIYMTRFLKEIEEGKL